MEPRNGRGGRPSKYQPWMVRQARIMCIAGWTDEQMAEMFGVAVSTFNLWKKAYPEFSEALKAKALADATVEASLYERACGYSHEDVHVSNYQGEITLTPLVKRYPPDATAMIFWLKNRQPDRWRQVPLEGDDSTPPAAVPVTVQDASTPEPGA